MDGILLLDKPKGMTSHDVVNLVRKAYHTKKVGHAGTLDPDATGLLVVGVNKGTKILQYLTADDKVYEATICFGAVTDTLDDTGEILLEEPVEDISNFEYVLSSFEGEYEQTPPMFSAIKYQGKRLYEYAREGIEIEDRPSRMITIHEIEPIGDISYQDSRAYASYRVHGSKGLYVRTLSYDIGASLGIPAYNYALCRVRSGRFLLEESYSLEDLKQGETVLLSLTDALCNYPKVVATTEMKEDISHGRTLSLEHFQKATLTRIVDQNDTLLALYDKHPSLDVMKAKNVFMKD
jgi:tRNA pseudouridine55 synthase